MTQEKNSIKTPIVEIFCVMEYLPHLCSFCATGATRWLNWKGELQIEEEKRILMTLGFFLPPYESSLFKTSTRYSARNSSRLFYHS